jgi:hypothetical protein
MVTFWYQADPPAAGVLPVAVWDQRYAADTSLYSVNGYTHPVGVDCPRLVGHRFRGVRLAAGTGKHPVVLWSLGGTASRKLAEIEWGIALRF